MRAVEEAAPLRRQAQGALDVQLSTNLGLALKPHQERDVRIMLAAELGPSLLWTPISPGASLSCDGAILLRGPPPPERGGALCAQTGMGKTLTMCALIDARPSPAHAGVIGAAGPSSGAAGPALPPPAPVAPALPGLPPGGTLVVVPAISNGEVVEQWLLALSAFPRLRKHVLNMYDRKAGEEALTPARLAAAKVVVTSVSKFISQEELRQVRTVIKKYTKIYIFIHT